MRVRELDNNITGAIAGIQSCFTVRGPGWSMRRELRKLRRMLARSKRSLAARGFSHHHPLLIALDELGADLLQFGGYVAEPGFDRAEAVRLLDWCRVYAQQIVEMIASLEAERSLLVHRRSWE